MFKKILPFLLILLFRFTGLFIVLPVISLLISTMENADSIKVGLAIGAPYLMQMIFQPIFGRLSDRFGRKIVLIIGLFIFLLGSIICMLESNIYYLIIGRCVQGVGAVGAILTALVADSTKESERTKAMALMGVAIFASFILAMILGSLLGAHFGLNSLFALTCVMAVISLLIALFGIKKAAKITFVYPQNSLNESVEKSTKMGIITLSLGSFVEKFLMLLTFALAPIILGANLEKTQFYYIYLPAVICAIFALAPASIFGEKKNMAKQVLLSSIFMFFVSYILMAIFVDNIVVFGVAFGLFFSAFAIQEAILQSLISKLAKAKFRGAVIGDFNAAGFAGSFVGALVGGFFHTYDAIVVHHWLLFSPLILAMIVWFFITLYMLKNPDLTRTLYLPTGTFDIAKLDSIKGIVEYYENTQEKLVAIKYNTQILDSKSLESILNIKGK
ncbi:MFS transporter [Helicobacter saguini]|uniref:MFS transporter n=1 Tax=Helicobacter saguini TaxID=1548018 RepID=A0A347VSR9_9HELI|nr:MFS transporter [Helicobacter saguini]MWV62388.1 MFS transporter [Helicobacter saguini]MWV66940.1 MFS transporter [Helicobacter saguini]MWV69288.1 MFS transporter [Helicobacter saguini]MWV71156.1 MFS transporter [Helicobacter saguini]TLD94953.1 MFS transporter [Helicobacter saguini]